MDMKEIERVELEKTEKIPTQLLKKTNQKKEKLHIVYLMVWTKTCGGSKIILEYANRLSKRGHKITIVTYDEKPTWFPLEDIIEFIQVPSQNKLEEYIPECDLVVATSWKNISAALMAKCAPAVFFEQGGSHIFDVKSLSSTKKKIVSQRMSEISFVYTVSSYTKKIIQQEYQKEAFVVPNAVDDTIFYPTEKTEETEDANITITTIGPEEFEFKRIDNVIKAITELKNQYHNIEFKWISQTEPRTHKEKAIVNPPQKEIGDILRKTDIYICASDYESFCLPALEAMTCGAAVITTDNGGISDFVEDKVNGLVIKRNDVEDIIAKIQFLIENPNERIKIASNGLKTAKGMSWSHSVEKLEKYYQEISQYEIEDKPKDIKNEKEDAER